MPNYKPVKILFDLDDEHQLRLYNELKARANQSSYIRTLIYGDINNKSKKVEEPKFEPFNTEIKNTIVNSYVNEDEIILEGIF